MRPRLVNSGGGVPLIVGLVGTDIGYAYAIVVSLTVRCDPRQETSGGPLLHKPVEVKIDIHQVLRFVGFHVMNELRLHARCVGLRFSHGIDIHVGRHRPARRIEINLGLRSQHDKPIVALRTIADVVRQFNSFLERIQVIDESRCFPRAHAKQEIALAPQGIRQGAGDQPQRERLRDGLFRGCGYGSDQ